ncbi:MAG: tetratricopeptide repeat protein [Pseudomonadota bacterium]|nr:tetratricopeptide repeat protein [Pseudomonadota bacterium]
MAKTFEPTINRVEPTRSAEAAIKRGKKLLSEKRFDEALVEFEAVVEQDQATPFVLSAIGRIKFKQKDLDGALKHFKAAIKLDPTQPQAYLRAARIYAAQGKLANAREELQNAIRVNPKSAVAYAGLGQLMAREKQTDQAIEQFKKALSFNPRMMLARKRLASTLLSKGNLTEAKDQVKAALRVKPDDPEAYVVMGKVHLAEKDYDAAQRAYEEAIELKPESNPAVFLALAEAYIAGGKPVQAEELLNKIPQRDQFSPMLHKLWGDLYDSKGMHKEALEEYRAASLTVGEDLGIERLDSLDLGGEDVEDEKWEEMASAARTATAAFIEKKREAGGGNAGA